MIVRMVNGTIFDDKFGAGIKKIRIVEPGIVVEKNDYDHTRTFFPWHAIEFCMGQDGEFEHELEQFNYLGTGGHGR